VSILLRIKGNLGWNRAFDPGKKTYFALKRRLKLNYFA
jgi:hypothetical protein